MIQYDGSTPFYQQLKEHILEMIKQGSLKAHQQLASERELCEQFNLSRTTIRLALAELEKDGLVYKVHGKGTFVSEPKIVQGLSTINSFEDTILSKGLNPKISVLSVEVLPADLTINTILQLGMDEEITKLIYLGCANEDVVVHYEAYLSSKIGQAVAKEALKRVERGESFSTFELYRDCCGVIPAVTNQTFEATAAEHHIADSLQVSEGAPVFLITSIVYTDNNTPIEYKRAHYRGDKFKFHISRKHL